jgi:hypothetical protein
MKMANQKNNQYEKPRNNGESINEKRNGVGMAAASSMAKYGGSGKA